VQTGAVAFPWAPVAQWIEQRFEKRRFDGLIKP